MWKTTIEVANTISANIWAMVCILMGALMSPLFRSKMVAASPVKEPISGTCESGPTKSLLL